MKIAYAVTIPATAQSFLTGQLAHLVKAGHEVRLFTNDEPLLHEFAAREGVSAQGLPLVRQISPIADLKALWATFRAFRAYRPDLTVIGTPKAGLIGGLAAWLARVPARIFVNHGIRGETVPGLKGKAIRLSERIIHACAHQVICVSPSVRDRVIELNMAPASKLIIVCSGSANGIDIERFSTPLPPLARGELQRRLGLKEGEQVIGFVGRIVRDKGVNELVAAFVELGKTRPNLRLLLVGGHEDLDPVAPETRARIEQGDGIVWAGPVADPAPYYQLMDLFVLPSYREGLGVVCLEAGAAGVAAISTTATGARDGVIDGVTGRLVRPGDTAALTAAIAELLDDPERSARMGRAAQERVRTAFQPEPLWDSLEKLYRRLGAGKPRGKSSQHAD